MTCGSYASVKLEKNKEPGEQSGCRLTAWIIHVASPNTERLLPPTVCSALQAWPPTWPRSSLPSSHPCWHHCRCTGPLWLHRQYRHDPTSGPSHLLFCCLFKHVPMAPPPSLGFYSNVTFLGGDSESKESACNAGDLGLIPGSGRSPGGGHGNPLQRSCLENPMDGGAWRAQSMGSQRVELNWVTKHIDTRIWKVCKLLCHSK